jgi:hypothetical protein
VYGTATMTKPFRILRWAGLTVLLMLALRGAYALLLDALGWCATEELRYVTPGTGWTAFERCIDYTFIADRDTVLCLGRSMDDKSTWIRIAPTDTHLMGSMEWRGPKHLWIPATFRTGCFRCLDDVVIEWATR